MVGGACAAADQRLERIAREADGGADLDDVERWLELDGIVSDAGIELVEWFVVGIGGVACPRELVGEPERWAA